MTAHDLHELAPDELATVTGGLSWDTVKGGFGLRTVYRETVKGITAGVGGWKLANEMYGSKEHGAPWAEKRRAMGALKSYLDASDELPSWAPNW